MKRLLMITSVIGLCLSAPAFAQSTTEQEQLNKQQQAAPPSTSAPAAQTQDRQRSNQAQQPSSGSSSSSVQAPASQDQKDQAQQPSSGSSSSSVQAPASQDQKGQAQNQRKPADSSTNAQLPADQKPSATDRKQRAQSDKQNRQSQQKMQRQDAQSSSSTDRSASRSGTERSSGSAKVSINDDQRTRIAAAISSTNVRSVNVNFRIATGVVVPRTVVLHVLPTSIVAIVPQYRGYRYFVTNDEIVIVEPRRKTIIATLPAGGTARAQAPASAKRISFSDEQREVIRKRASTLRSSATTGAGTSRILVEQEVPATIELQEFPAEIVTEVPLVRSYRFFRQDNDVFVVDPTERRVIEIIR